MARRPLGHGPADDRLAACAWRRDDRQRADRRRAPARGVRSSYRSRGGSPTPMPAGNRPARLDAALSAAEFDVDGAIAFAGNALAGASFDRPGEIALVLDFGKATYAGVEARAAKAKLNFDGDGLADRADVDRRSRRRRGQCQRPHRYVVGVPARLDRDDDRCAAAGRRGATGGAVRAPRRRRDAGTGRPRGNDPVDRQARCRTGRRVGRGCEDVGQAAGRRRARRGADRHRGGRKRRRRARFRRPTSTSTDDWTSDDGAGLARLLGLDRYVVGRQRPARVDVRRQGRARRRTLRIEGKFAGAGLEATAAGSLRVAATRRARPSTLPWPPPTCGCRAAVRTGRAGEPARDDWVSTGSGSRSRRSKAGSPARR